MSMPYCQSGVNSLFGQTLLCPARRVDCKTGRTLAL